MEGLARVPTGLPNTLQRLIKSENERKFYLFNLNSKRLATWKETFVLLRACV